MGGGVDHFLVAGQEMRARRCSFTAGDLPHCAAVGVHPIDPIARLSGSPGLKRELFAVEGPIGFGILAAVGQPAKVGEVGLLGQRRGRRFLLSRAGQCEGAEQDDQEFVHPREDIALEVTQTQV